ncbi:MAG: hypothetical protein E5V33_09505 [Mesorhizobium sp.]|nr:MAG: hypothetical protein E5V33_09505 [Mesorhizobium sp.]
MLRDVAKVAKHVQLDRGKPDVTTAAQMSTRSLGSGEARWEEDRWGSPPQAIVNTDAGEHRVLETVVEQPLAVSFVKL